MRDFDDLTVYYEEDGPSRDITNDTIVWKCGVLAGSEDWPGKKS